MRPLIAPGARFATANPAGVPWANVDDEPSGNPHFYRTDTDAEGAYSLLTLVEPHNVRISAVGYRAVDVRIGKAWFLWWPQGEERHDVGSAAG